MNSRPTTGTEIVKSRRTDTSSRELVDHDHFPALWTVAAAFSTYFCMYAFRKPFTAAQFDGELAFGMPLKSLLIISQVIGYAISKFVGIRVIAEMPASGRARALILLIGASEAALILFGCIPRPWNVACLFLNGLPLGMVFGLVLGFLEGRRVTEALTAGLCASFILADGAHKSAGAWLLTLGVSEDWMPSAAGAIFFVPLLISVTILARTPPPSQQDIEARSERVQMDRTARRTMLHRYGVGLGALILMYLLLTVLRSLRADFASEIWRGLGVSAVPSTFTVSEIVVATGVLIVNGSLVYVRDNLKAFRLSLLTCLCGFVLIGFAIIARSFGLSGFSFMVLNGLGLYLPYVAVHATVFERLLAITRDRGNVGFLMYLADSTGYLGYISCMLFKAVFDLQGDFLPFFILACWLTCGLSILCVLTSLFYFSGQRISQTNR